MSPEAKALLALHAPAEPKPGDMWLCRRLGIVSVNTGHLKGRGKHANRPTSFHLYHWKARALTARPACWRDADPQSGLNLPYCDVSETWEYVGNLFEILPYSAIAGGEFLGTAK